MFKKIVSEPLVYFIIIGSILYGVYYLLNSDTQAKIQKPLSLTSDERMQLKSHFYSLWQRQPNQIELEVMIQQMYQEKILVEEALGLGLEKSDPYIVSRLIGQMKDILSSQSTFIEPTEKQLYDYYLAHIHDYSSRIALTFSYLNFQNLTPVQKQEFAKMLQGADLIPVDKSSFFNTHRIQKMKISHIQQEFGNYFTRQIEKLKPLRWYGPISSKKGECYIYIRDMETENSYMFDEVQDRVYRDFLEERKRVTWMNNFQKASTQYILERP